MHKRILAICVAIFLALAVIPTGFADNSDQVVITYGETAYMNQQYKSIVDNYFAGKTNVNINDIDSKVITAGDVNKISGGFSGKQYNSNQIFSSALLDLNQNGEITVDVDNSITTITPEMYMSALKSAGIQGGHVYVTSPVSATGESALAGIMDCYEEATDVEIPDNVKEAANQEIATQAEILNNSNVSADDLNKLVDDVKENLNQYIFKTVIPRNVRLAEAPSYGLPVNIYDKKSEGAKSYKKLAKEIIKRRKALWQPEEA